MDHDFEARADRNREFVYKGTRWELDCRDPYGFWYVSFKEGKTPDVLRGAYTSFITAEKDIEKYVQNRPMKSIRDAKSGRTTAAPDME